MLGETQEFLWRFARYPTRTGAIAPATRALASMVAISAREAYRRHVARGEPAGLEVIELGAGTGALSRKLGSLKPVLVERDQTWAAALATTFPHLDVRAECATQTLRSIAKPVGLVTSIPLLNNPQADEIREGMARAYQAGWLKFCVLYTYGIANPLRDIAFLEARRRFFVLNNLPPAFVWAYR